MTEHDEAKGIPVSSDVSEREDVSITGRLFKLERRQRPRDVDIRIEALRAAVLSFGKIHNFDRLETLENLETIYLAKRFERYLESGE